MELVGKVSRVFNVSVLIICIRVQGFPCSISVGQRSSRKVLSEREVTISLRVGA